MRRAETLTKACFVMATIGLVLHTGCSEKDTSAPAAPWVEAVEAATCDADPVVSGTAEFGARVRITGGASEVTTTADPYTARFRVVVPLAAGAQALSVTATDVAGNESEATSVDVSIIEGRAEVVDLVLDMNMVEAGASVAYTTTVMDSCGNQLDDVVSVFTNAPGAVASAGTITGLVRSGSWTVVAEVPGTPAADTETLIVDPDETSAVVVLQLSALSAFVGVPLGYTVTAVDGFGNNVDQATLAVTTSDDGNGALVDPVTQSISFATSGAPSHTVTATLFGGTANEISDGESVLVTNPDLSPPSVAITDPLDGDIVADRNIVITVNASDDQGLAQIFLQATGVDEDFQQQLVPNNPGTTLPELGPRDFTFTLNIGGGTVGDIVLVAQAVDTNGNFTSSVPVTITVDPARALVFDAGKYTISTVSAGRFLDNPRGITYDATVDQIYVANNNPDPVLVVEIDPAGGVLSNQNPFVLNQGVDGEDLAYFDGGAGNRYHFLSTNGGSDRVLRISGRTAVGTGGGTVEVFSSNNGNSSRGITIESATSIAVLFNDEIIRRYDPTTASGSLPIGASSSMDASNALGNSWGLELLGLGCQAGDFPCANGTECIPTADVCASNGSQCSDGSDEGAACNGNRWICDDGTTEILPSQICDGDIDCTSTTPSPDFADEANCTHYAATDNGGNDEAWRFYDNGNGNLVAHDVVIADQPPLSNPKGIAVSPTTGRIYVASRDSDNLTQIDPVTLSRTVIAAGFNRSWGLAFDGNGDLLITDEGDDIVYRLTAIAPEEL